MKNKEELLQAGRVLAGDNTADNDNDNKNNGQNTDQKPVVTHTPAVPNMSGAYENAMHDFNNLSIKLGDNPYFALGFQAPIFAQKQVHNNGWQAAGLGFGFSQGQHINTYNWDVNYLRIMGDKNQPVAIGVSAGETQYGISAHDFPFTQNSPMELTKWHPSYSLQVATENKKFGFGASVSGIINNHNPDVITFPEDTSGQVPYIKSDITNSPTNFNAFVTYHNSPNFTLGADVGYSTGTDVQYNNHKITNNPVDINTTLDKGFSAHVTAAVNLNPFLAQRKPVVKQIF